MTSLKETLTAQNLALITQREIARIACELRPDVEAALEVASRAETHPRGRIVLDHLMVNAAIAAEQRVPLCQDTGSVWVLLEVGEKDSHGNAITVPTDIFSLLDEAVARVYEEAALRKSLVKDALIDRQNTGDNTPAFAELSFSPKAVGATLHIMLKGGGSDNASRVVMLAPGAGTEGVKQVVRDAVREKAASACPPLIVGVGVGATFDKVGSLSKRALLRPVGQSNPVPELAELEKQLLEEINAFGIGPGGLGGDTTALAVHIITAPSHIASLPVAVNIGCNATRSCSIDLETVALPLGVDAR
jgi:tartrate/fumarate subfamily iron-sulfur-dependent hydro-lyase alpha chain